MRNKAQTAMEYLMTYGWAILIIIVVVAALYAMGVFRLGGTIPCSPCFSYFSYSDHDATNVYLTNGARSIEISGTPYQAGDTITYAHSCAGTDPCTVSITYSVVLDDGTTVSHTDTGTLRGGL